MKLHYATLRLGIAATEAQIKVAYRARAQQQRHLDHVIALE
jgi:DnaJ-class molecular chaperone